MDRPCGLTETGREACERAEGPSLNGRMGAEGEPGKVFPRVDGRDEYP